MYCPKCGNQLPPNTEICPKCGSPAAIIQKSDQSANLLGADQPKNKKSGNKNNLALIVLAALLVGAVLASGGYILADKVLLRSENNSTSESQVVFNDTGETEQEILHNNKAEEPTGSTSISAQAEQSNTAEASTSSSGASANSSGVQTKPSQSSAKPQPTSAKPQPTSAKPQPTSAPKPLNLSIQKKQTFSAGHYHTVGLKSDGTVVAVGSNNYGQCDVSGWKNIVAVSARASYTIGLKSDGTVVAVGWNNYGQCDVSEWKRIKLPQ